MLEERDALFELVDVVGSTQPRLLAGPFAEHVGQPFLQVLDADSEPGRAVLGVEQVGRDARLTAGPPAGEVGGWACEAWIWASRSGCR